MPVRGDGKMLQFDGKLAKRLFWLGIFVASVILGSFLERQGIWSGVPLLLGLGSVLAFYFFWDGGVAFNLLKVWAFSLPAIVLFYLALDFVFPGTLTHRLDSLAKEPFFVGVLLGFLLLRPVRRPGMRQGPGGQGAHLGL